MIRPAIGIPARLVVEVGRKDDHAPHMSAQESSVGRSSLGSELVKGGIGVSEEVNGALIGSLVDRLTRRCWA